jgi:hypothetical protein
MLISLHGRNDNGQIAFAYLAGTRNVEEAVITPVPPGPPALVCASSSVLPLSAVCDVMWCGVVWCGVVWCGVVWCGVVWCGVVWCGVVWNSVVWCDVILSYVTVLRVSSRLR